MSKGKIEKGQELRLWECSKRNEKKKGKTNTDVKGKETDKRTKGKNSERMNLTQLVLTVLILYYFIILIIIFIVKNV